MSQKKKTVIAAVSVFICLCITCISVGIIRKNRENTTTKTSGQTKTAESNLQSSTAASTESSTDLKTELTESAETTENKTVTQKAETTTVKPTKPYKPSENYTFSPDHEIAGSLPKNKAVSGSWFDDAVFVGDSVSLKLTMYESSVNRLGKAQFLTAGSLSATNALWDVSDNSVHPKYKGKKQKIEDSISQMSGVKKVYIMLGMNDINAVGPKNSIKNFEKLCNNILKKSPDVQIYVQSVTPLMKGSKSSVSKEGKLNNKTIYEYNKMLAALAQKRGWYFVNVAEVMYDKGGYLKKEYCGDPDGMGLHFTNEGCKAWIDYLLTHTPSDVKYYQYDKTEGASAYTES